MEDSIESDLSLRKEACKTSIKEGSAYSFMDGFGLRYITPFALALGASTTVVGLISTLPNFIGNISQTYSLRIMERSSRKKIVVPSVLFQAVMWLPLIIVGVLYFNKTINSLIASIILLFLYSLIVIAGSFAVPAWTSWMKDIVTEKHASYYGKRNAILGFIALTGMIVAGFILDYFDSKNPFYGFAILFIIAFIGRSVSGYFFTKKYEPELKYDEGYYFTFREFVKKMPHNNFGRFVIYFSLMTFAVTIASPFLAVYMLDELHFSYTMFTLVTISASVSTLIFVPLWGRVADKYGNITVLKICGFFIPLMPLIWFLSNYFSNKIYVVFFYLVFVEIISGIVWSGFNLAASTFITLSVSRQRIGVCVAYYSIISSFCALIGALIGGIISSYDFEIFGITSILFIMLLSFVIRVLVYFFVSPMIKEVRQVDSLDIKQIREKILKRMPSSLWHNNLGVKRSGINQAGAN